MKITVGMIQAARHGEFNYYQKDRALGSRFVPTPDPVIRAMLEGALRWLAELEHPPAPSLRASAAVSIAPTPATSDVSKRSNVTARRPQPKR